MTIINTIAILILVGVIIFQRIDFSKRLELIHGRIQGMQDRQFYMSSDNMKAEIKYQGLEESFRKLHDTTNSALNIFEQQILRGAKEDLEALDEPLEDDEAEE